MSVSNVGGCFIRFNIRETKVDDLWEGKKKMERSGCSRALHLLN